VAIYRLGFTAEERVLRATSLFGGLSFGEKSSGRFVVVVNNLHGRVRAPFGIALRLEVLLNLLVFVGLFGVGVVDNLRQEEWNVFRERIRDLSVDSVSQCR
jgi:hypothetical protein